MAKEMFCTNCGYKGKPKQMVKGKMSTELLLWLLFIVPGLIYSIWRLANVYKGCPACKADSLIPANSPMAKQLLATLTPKPATPPPPKKVAQPNDDPYYDKEKDIYIIDAK
ncbi:MAG: hypothetical protein ACYCYR_09395 [Desulfobulbaceae bacterium]|jgi:hypothetical protein